MKSVAVLVAVCFIQCIAGEPLLGLFGGNSRHYSNAHASAHASSHGHGGGGILGGILPGGDDCDDGLLSGLPVIGGVLGGGGQAEAHANAHAQGGRGGNAHAAARAEAHSHGGGVLDGIPLLGGLFGGGADAHAAANAQSGGGGNAQAEAHAAANGGILGDILGGGSSAHASASANGGGGILGGLGGGILGGCDGILGGDGIGSVLGGGGILGGLSGGILNGGILGGGITSFPRIICQTITSSVTTITTQVTRYVTITKTVLPIIERLPVISDLAPSLGLFDDLSNSLTPAFQTIGNDADDCSRIIGHGTEISPAIQNVHSGVQDLISTTRDSYSQSTTSTTIVQVRQQIEVVIRRLFTYVSNCRLTIQKVYTFINHDDVSSPDLSTGLAAIGKLTIGLRTTLQITTTVVQKFTQITNIRSTELIGTTKYLDQVTTTVQTLETSLSRCTSITNVRPVLASVLGDLNDISTGIVSQPCFNVQPNNVCAGPIGPAGVIQQTTQAISQTTETRTVLQRVVTTLGSVSQYIQTQVQQVSTQVVYETVRTRITSLQNVIYRVLNRFAFLSVHKVQSVYTEVTAYYSQITTIIKTLSTTIDSWDATIIRPYLVVFQQFFQSIVYITQVTYETFQTVYGRTVSTTTTKTTTITEQRTVEILNSIESRLTAINIGTGPGGVIVRPNGPGGSRASASASASSGPNGSTATAAASASSGPRRGPIYPGGPGPVQIPGIDDDDQSPSFIDDSPDIDDDDNTILPIPLPHPVLRPLRPTAHATATATATTSGPRGPRGPRTIYPSDDDDSDEQPTIVTTSPDGDDDDVTILPIPRPRPNHQTATAAATASVSNGPRGRPIYPRDDDDQSPTVIIDSPDYPADDDSDSPLLPLRPHDRTSAAAVSTASSGPHGSTATAAATASSGPRGVHVYRPSPRPINVDGIDDDNDYPSIDTESPDSDEVQIIRPTRPHTSTVSVSATAGASTGPYRRPNRPVIVGGDDDDDSDYPQGPVVITPRRPRNTATATATAIASTSSPDRYRPSPIGVYPDQDDDDDSPVTILPIDRRPTRGTSSATAAATATSGDGTATASASASATSGVGPAVGPYATLFNTYQNRLVTEFNTLRQEIVTISRTVRTSYDHTIIITKITKVQTLISSLVQYISQLDDNVVHSRICPVTFNSGITAITTVTKEISVTINEFIQSGRFTQVVTKRLYSLVQRITAYAYYPTYYTTNILRRITTSSVQVTTIVPNVLKNLISSFSSVSSVTDTTEYQDNGLQPYISGLSTCGNDLTTVPIDVSEVRQNQVANIHRRIASAVQGVNQVRNSFQKLSSNVKSIQQRAVVLASAVSDITHNLSEVSADNEELSRNLDESLSRLQGAIADSNNLGIYNHFATSSASASASASASSNSYGSSAIASAAASSVTHPYHIVVDNGNRFCNTIRHYNRWLPQPLPC